MKLRKIVTVVSILALGSMAGAAASEVFFRTPEASWEQLLPYLEAKLRVENRGGELWVGLSGADYERELFEPYDPVMGEWATILLGEMLRDKKLSRVLDKVNKDLVRELPDVESMDRNELMSAYWSRLEADGRFLSRLRAEYEKAHATGRLRCVVCEYGFQPQYLTALD